MRAATQTDHHLHIDGGASLFDAQRFDTERLLGHRQVSDAWLLGMKVSAWLRFVTFDAAVPMGVVRGDTA